MLRSIDRLVDMDIFTKLGGVLVIGFFGVVLISALAAVPVMLAAGILNGFFPAVPAFSYFQTLALVIAWSIIWNRMRFTTES